MLLLLNGDGVFLSVFDGTQQIKRNVTFTHTQTTHHSRSIVLHRAGGMRVYVCVCEGDFWRNGPLVAVVRVFTFMRFACVCLWARRGTTADVCEILHHCFVFLCCKMLCARCERLRFITQMRLGVGEGWQRERADACRVACNAPAAIATVWQWKLLPAETQRSCQKLDGYGNESRQCEPSAAGLFYRNASESSADSAFACLYVMPHSISHHDEERAARISAIAASFRVLQSWHVLSARR